MERQGLGRATRPSQGEGTRRRPRPPLLHRARSARPPFLALLGLIAAWREVSSRDARDRFDEADAPTPVGCGMAPLLRFALFVQAEAVVQRANRELRVLLVDQTG